MEQHFTIAMRTILAALLAFEIPGTCEFPISFLSPNSAYRRSIQEKDEGFPHATQYFPQLILSSSVPRKTKSTLKMSENPSSSLGSTYLLAKPVKAILGKRVRFSGFSYRDVLAF